MTALPLACDLGPDDALPVLLLHGFLGHGADWDPVAPRLYPAFRALAPDLPGHGRAVDLPADAYTMNGAADALAVTLDAVGVEQAAVVGYSMGGRLALHFALRHAERVERLVLLGASPGLRTEEERAERRRLDAERAAAIRDDLPGFLEAWYRMPLFAPLSNVEHARLVRERRRNDPEELARSLAGMGTGAQPSHWEHLRSLRVPAWAVTGQRDAKFSALAEEMAFEGTFRAVGVPAVGHALLTRPLALGDLLRRLLSHPS